MCLQYKGHPVDHSVRKIPWRRGWLPTPVFLPEVFYAKKQLVDYSSWGCKESDITEELTVPLSLSNTFQAT